MKNHNILAMKGYLCTLALLASSITALGAGTADDYPINFRRDTVISRSDRNFDGVAMNGTSLDLNAGIYAGDKLLFHENIKKTFFARPGQQTSAAFSFTGTWMNGYVYIDKGQDGEFSWSVGDDGRPLAESDLVAFSHLDGKNSNGEAVGGNTLAPPSFPVPALPDGFYRIRFKIDWDCADPGGNTSETNSIIQNGGGIADARLRIFSSDKVSLSLEACENGSLLTGEGESLPESWEFNSPLRIKAVPAEGYRLSSVQIVHGDLSGEEIIHSVPQRLTSVFLFDSFADGELTIPADIIDGDLRIAATFIPDDGYVPPAHATLRAEDCAGGEVLLFDGTSLSDAVEIPDGCMATVLVYPDAGQKLTELRISSVDNEIVADPSKMSLNRYDIPAGMFENRARVVCTATFEPLGEGERGWTKIWRLTWSDEFNSDGTLRPDETKWETPARYSSAWNRFIADNDAVSYVTGGNYVTRCIANPDRTTDDVAMISGAIQSRNKYSFMYGRVEARIKTTPHSGNFPAFWLMPQEQPDGWPNNGEIDIMEQINSQNTAFQTIHSNWSYNLGKKNDPASGGSCSVNMNLWHDYALEWDAAQLRWFVDGKRVFSYAKKSSDADALSKGQWPFDRDFYVILNQSVGNGSWAYNPDESFQYETLFDYVRVYQLFDRDDATGISSAVRDGRDDKAWYDLQGRRIEKPVRSGVYIQGRKKIFVR